MLNPDLYAVLPPDKKEEYKKLFPVPKRTPVTKSLYDSYGMCWFYQDYEFVIVPEEWSPSGYAFLGERIIKPQGVGVRAIAFMPPEYIPGSLTCETYIDNYLPHIECRTSEPEIGLSHGEQRLIKKGVV